MNNIPEKIMCAIADWEIAYDNDNSARKFVQAVVKHRKQNSNESFVGMNEAFKKFEDKYVEFLAVSNFDSPGVKAFEEIKKLREMDCGIY